MKLSAEMKVAQIVTLVVALVIAGLFLVMAYAFDRKHTQGRKECDAVQGVWFDREMKCVTGNNLKETK